MPRSRGDLMVAILAGDKSAVRELVGNPGDVMRRAEAAQLEADQARILWHALAGVKKDLISEDKAEDIWILAEATGVDDIPIDEVDTLRAKAMAMSATAHGLLAEAKKSVAVMEAVRRLVPAAVAEIEKDIAYEAIDMADPPTQATTRPAYLPTPTTTPDRNDRPRQERGGRRDEHTYSTLRRTHADRHRKGLGFLYEKYEQGAMPRWCIVLEWTEDKGVYMVLDGYDEGKANGKCPLPVGQEIDLPRLVQKFGKDNVMARTRELHIDYKDVHNAARLVPVKRIAASDRRPSGAMAQAMENAGVVG